ncbi:MAG: hypothetical protein JXK07_10805 [Spirochaetes bacterium]|nr:hypothetical protein [Spirochaetota bacterium]MBN2771114.1 hypothetical protein [Spirochaetota bacterium]
MKKKEQHYCLVKSKHPSLEEKRSDKHGTFSGYSPETVQIIALEDCTIILFHHFASLSLRESGDKHGTFSGYSPETVQIIALEDCAIIWTMWFIFFICIMRPVFHI